MKPRDLVTLVCFGAPATGRKRDLQEVDVIAEKLGMSRP
jgi:hypothetical protein